MNILVFGGTTEGRLAAAHLAEHGHTVTVSVATSLGAEALRNTPSRVLTGRLSEGEITVIAADFDLVIDATHPYAQEVSRNIRSACEACGVPLRRILREASPEADCVHVESCREAADYLRNKPGSVLIATGSKDLAAYAVLESGRLYPRVLPTHEALSACEALGIPHSHILALQGPFSAEMNTAMLRQYGISYLVTKDGGSAGGFSEKQEAARKAGAQMIVVGRPPDSGISLEQLYRELEEQA